MLPANKILLHMYDHGDGEVRVESEVQQAWMFSKNLTYDQIYLSYWYISSGVLL